MHEQLKAICEKIGYEDSDLEMQESGYFMRRLGPTTLIGIDERQIIFTPSFRDAFIKYLEGEKGDYHPFSTDAFNSVCFYLDNPTQYLYNLIF